MRTCLQDRAIASYAHVMVAIRADDAVRTTGLLHCHGRDGSRAPGSGPAESLKQARRAPAVAVPRFATNAHRVLAAFVLAPGSKQ